MATINNRTSNTLISGSSGADSIYNSAANVTIQSGGGKDTITNSGSNVSVFGGAGADVIKSTGGTKVTLHGGTGNDTLTGSSKAEVFQFRYDGGSDVITNFGTNDTLHIAAGNLNTYYADGNDIIVGVKSSSTSGTVRLKNAASNLIKLKVGTSAVQTINAINTVNSATANKLITGSAVRDSIKNTASKVTINGGRGADTITNTGSNVSLFGSAGDDVIISTGGNGVTINGGTGNDTLTGSSKAEVFQFYVNGGNDVITNIGTNDTLHIATGTLDTYYAEGNDIIVGVKSSTTSGTVRLKNAATRAIKLRIADNAVTTINAINKINNTTANRLVTGSGVRDSIKNSASKVTINGGRGNDTLTGSSKAEVFQFSADGGNDIVTNFATNDTLHLVAGSIDTYYIDGNDLVVGAKDSSSSGTIRLKNAADNPVKLKVGSNAVQTINTINTDTNITAGKKVNGSGVRDVISNLAANVTLYGDKGNDTLTNFGNGVSINGGVGDDSVISFGGSNVTINGGDGNDTLTGSNDAEVFQIRAGGGNDVITNFGVNDTLQITGGSIASYYADDNDVLLSVTGADGSNVVRLNDALSTSINVLNAAGAKSVLPALNYIVTLAATANGTFSLESYNANNSPKAVHIDASAVENSLRIYGDANANSIVSGNSGKANTVFTIIGGAGNDTIYGGNRPDYFYYTTLDGSDVIYNYEDNDVVWLYNNQTVFQNVSLSGDDVIVNLTNGEHLTLKNARDKQIDIDTGTYRADLYDYTFGRASLNGDTLKINSDYIGSQINMELYAESLKGLDVSSYANSMYIRGTANNDVIRSGNSDLTSAVYTLRGGEGNDTLYGGNRTDIFYYTSVDGSDVIYNFDESDVLWLYNSTATLQNVSISGDDLILNLSNDNQITLKSAADKQIDIDYGSNRSNLYDLTFGRVSINGDTLSLNQNYLGTDIYMEMYAPNPKVFDGSNFESNLHIHGTGSNDIIRSGNADYTASVYTISGGEGNDTLYGSTRVNAADESIRSGNRTDIFRYVSGDGDDVIYNYEDNDIIWLYDGATMFQNVSLSGDDVIINLTTGNSITLKDAAAYQIDIDYGANRANLHDLTFGCVSINGDTLAVNQDYLNNTINMELYGESLTALDASNFEHSIYLRGTGSNDVIYSGNSDYTETVYTVRGGEGNDTLYGGNRQDIFYYESTEGSDVIYNYADNDVIWLYNSVSLFRNVSLSGDDVIINLTTGNSITLKDAKDKQIDIDTGTNRANLYDLTFGSVSITGDTLTVNENYLNNTINMEHYAETLTALDASNFENSISIRGTGSNDVIYSGNSDLSSTTYTLNGGAGNDTLYGGNRTDIFYYASLDGSDVIYNFDENDVIWLYNSSSMFRNVSFSGDDVIINLTTGNSITLKDAKDKQIDIDYGTGTTRTNLYDFTFGRVSIDGDTLTGDTLTVNEDYLGGEIRMELYSAPPKALDASNYENSLVIRGTAGNNVIRSGNSERTDVMYTLYGGEGDDTLYGGSRRDVFVYGANDGTDVIYDFTSNDRISLTSSSASLNNISYDNDDVILHLSNGGGITLKEARGVTLVIAGSSAGTYSTSNGSQLPVADDFGVDNGFDDVGDNVDDEYWFEKSADVNVSEIDQILQDYQSVAITDDPSTLLQQSKQSQLLQQAPLWLTPSRLSAKLSAPNGRDF